MVKVRLIEKSANKTEGTVIVVKVMIQNRMPGIALAITSSPRPKKSSHDCSAAFRATAEGTLVAGEVKLLIVMLAKVGDTSIDMTDVEASMSRGIA